MTTIHTHPTTDRDTAPDRPHQAAPTRRAAAGAVTTRRVLRSELIKLLSVRSTIYALVATVLAVVGIGTFVAFGSTMQEPPAGEPPPMDPTGGALSGVSLAVYLVAALGVLAVTSEYRTGTIKSSIAAVANRAALVWGKVLAVAVVILPVTLVATLTAFLGAKIAVSTADITISLGEPGVLRAVIGGALYLTAVAVFAGGLGWLLRSSAGALATLFGILIVLPVSAYLLPSGIRDAVMPYLPDSAGMAIMQTTTGPGQLAPWTGFGVFAAYTAATLIAATLLVRHRDA